MSQPVTAVRSGTDVSFKGRNATARFSFATLFGIASRQRKLSTRRLQRRWLWPALIVAIAAAILLDRRGWLLVRQVDDLANYHGREALVTRVIDGDTLDIAAPDELNNHDHTRIRLWGIDCPEIGRFGKSDEPYAREATKLAESMVEGERVRLFLEAHQPRDSFGRVLAHVELSGGSRSLNEALLDAGLAEASDRWPHSRLTRYAQVQLAARRRGVGMWAIATPATQAATGK